MSIYFNNAQIRLKAYPEVTYLFSFSIFSPVHFQRFRKEFFCDFQPFGDLVPVPISGKEALDQSLEPDQAIESEETGPAFLLAVGNVRLIEDISNVAAKEEKKRETVAADVRQVMENTELTEKQRLFCLYYIRCFNATRAYQKAYGCSYEAAGTAGQRLLQKVAIRDEIQRLKQGRLNRELINEEDIVQKYIDIAFADITDYVEFGQEEVPIICDGSVAMQKDPETGEEIPATQKINTIRLRDAADVDGSMISEVRIGQSGTSVKLKDSMKALQWLADHMDLATEEQRARIDQLRAQTDHLTGDDMELEDTSGTDGDIYG